jgi:hypothetical protein
MQIFIGFSRYLVYKMIKMNIKYKIFKLAFVFVMLVFVSSCGIGEAIQDIFTDGDDYESQQNENIGKSIDYRVFAADLAQVNVDDVTDVQIISFFLNIFKYSSATVQSDPGLLCNSSIIYYLDSNGEKVSYSTNQSVISYNESFPGIELSVNGNYLYVKTYNVPNHPTEYYLNSGAIKSCGNGYADGVELSGSYSTFIIPLSSEVTYPTALNDNAIGVALNGVLLFSQEVYIDNGIELQRTISSEKEILDSYMGRSSEKNGYYYLAEPGYFTNHDYKKEEDPSSPFSIQIYESVSDRNSLIGFAKDGFPIYGPYEYGTTSKPTSLDECRGHFGNTGTSSLTGFGEVYHYHVEAFEDISSNEAAIIGCYSGVSP